MHRQRCHLLQAPLLFILLKSESWVSQGFLYSKRLPCSSCKPHYTNCVSVHVCVYLPFMGGEELWGSLSAFYSHAHAHTHKHSTHPNPEEGNLSAVLWCNFLYSDRSMHSLSTLNVSTCRRCINSTLAPPQNFSFCKNYNRNGTAHPFPNSVVL